MFFPTEEARDVLDKTIEIFQKARVEYGDARFSQGTSTSISKDKEEENINYSSNYGFNLRVFKKGEWRSFGINTLEKKKVLEAAQHLVNFTPIHKQNKIITQNPWTVDKEIEAKKEIDLEETTKWIRDFFNLLKSKDKKIADVTVSLGVGKQEKIFANTEGTRLREKFPRFRLVEFVLAKEGTRVERGVDSIGKIAGMEKVLEIDTEKIANKVSSDAVNLLKAAKPPSGRIQVILDGDMTGLIAHESFGHGAEADQVLRNRSFLKPYFGKKVAEDFVTICDTGNFSNENGTFTFDDEGIRSQRTALVENGIFNSYLHTLETASSLNLQPTGNGRAQDFSRKVFARMTNTYFDAGNWKVEELFEGVKHGVYLVGGSHGMEDPEGGGIQVSSDMGWLIENGKKTKLVRGMTLTGKLLDLLKNIDAVANDFELRPGFCGKGYEDFVHVTSGGPHIRVKEAIISGG